MLRSIELPRGSITLRGYLDTPENRDAYPLVILFHGLLDSYDTPVFRTLHRALISAGAAVLAFDFNGHGTSGGSFADMTPQEECEDARAILSYARSLSSVTDITLLGHSLGGMTASLAASDDPVDHLILLAPAGMLPEEVRNGCVLGTSFDPINLPERIPVFSESFLYRPFLESAMTLSVYEKAAANTTADVLLLRGTEDELVPNSAVLRYQDIYRAGSGSRRVSLIEIPGADHEFTGYCEQVTAAVLSFLTLSS